MRSYAARGLPYVIDYQALLFKYIRHVNAVTGDTQINATGSLERFSKAEANLIKRIALEDEFGDCDSEELLYDEDQSQTVIL